MAVAFEQRRMHVDWVTSGSEAGVLTLAWLRVGPKWTGHATWEWHGADGGREVAASVEEPALRDPDDPLEGHPLRLAFAGGRTLQVDIRSAWPAWEPEEPCPVPEVGWRVLAPRATVRATWSDGRVSEGEGYADLTWARSWPLRGMGFRTWRWGRAHLEDRTVVYLDLRLAGGHEWRVGADWLAGPVDLEAMRLGFDADGGGAVDLGGRGSAEDCELWLDPGRVLVDGPVVDASRFPRWIDRVVAETFGGPAHETRWLSRASLRGPGVHRKIRGVALHELVRYGSLAR